ncbi:MAG: hypothetical protein M1837_001637 [Sclerophora amabilis]|nr:MAG: hypothetical protein M1837_001637 [Sclerophora amabilis]
MNLSSDHLTFLINHIVLPPKLPQAEESGEHGRGNSLLQFVLESAEAYCSLSHPDYQKQWSTVVKSFQSWVKLQEDGEVVEKELVNAMRAMKRGDSLALFVEAQNAGLIFRQTDRHLIVECFEASPRAAAVIGAKSSLGWSFPGRAVAVHLENSRVNSFQTELARTIHSMSVEKVEDVMPVSRKAGSTVVEERDTTDPKLVSNMLMSILAASGAPIEPKLVHKNIRDDVCWNDSKIPWRRAGLWLVIKVALQISLMHAFPNDVQHVQYKNFMLFLITRISKLALRRSLTAETLFIVNAKAARRALKLGPQIQDFVQSQALDIARRLHDRLNSDWLQIRQDDERNGISPIETDRARIHTALSLSTSRAYLAEAMERSENPANRHGFSPACSPRMSLRDDGLPEPTFLNVVEADCVFALADFETWVEQNLFEWVRTRPESSIACHDLSELLSSYTMKATTAYDAIPEQMSIMLLTVLEIWQGIDQLALQSHPLLAEYSPEIHWTIADPLLLPKAAQMQRLHSVQNYIQERHATKDKQNPSMFSDPSKKSFAVRFFHTSREHQDLRWRIEENAKLEKSRKEEEWRSKKEKYDVLTRQAHSLDHQNEIDEQGSFVHERARCQKCDLGDRAKAISIEVHEWPLPQDEVQCVTAVFELACPKDVAAWCDATYRIVNDLGRTGAILGERREGTLQEYAGLQSYYSARRQRISLASTTKSFGRSHYKALTFLGSLDGVFVHNGMRYRLFDSLSTNWVADQLDSPSVRAKCSTPLPRGPYKNLQYAVDWTSHTSNDVLSNQNDCPAGITLHEYIAFGSLRAGERLQWLNILKELASTDLTFNTEAVLTLVSQAAWQAGPCSRNKLRISHSYLQDELFTRNLLNAIERKLQSIEANWKESHTLSILIILTLRVISLVEIDERTKDSIRVLLEARAVALRWTRELVQYLHQITNPSRIEAVQHRILKAASLCRMTYNVDPSHRTKVLNSDKDLSTFVECAILLSDNCPSDLRCLPFDLQRSLLQDRKLSHALESTIRTLAQGRREGIDQAIKWIWRAFTVGTPWTALAAPNDRWMVTQTASHPHQVAQSVHLNVLEGRFLVDGQPLGRLPAEYMSQETFRRVLGSRVLRVSKADMPDMLYMTANTISGYQVYFGMRDQELIIRTKVESEVLELIPHRFFIGDLPAFFSNDHTHWLNLTSSEIELRPTNKSWQSSPKNWRMNLCLSLSSFLRLDHRTMIDIRSAISDQVAHILAPLEKREYLHVSLLKDGALEVHLPRYSLSFFVNKDGRLECRELSAIVDHNQSIDTLSGLHNRLVLRNAEPMTGQLRRLVIIPYGTVSVTRNQRHVDVRISLGPGESVRWYGYKLDDHLRRLGGVSDNIGCLYKAYLHAVTSFALPDPFTGRTGTEESLCCLRAKAMFPASPLPEEAITLVNDIADLTPRRVFYPEHLRSMQQIQWHGQLSSLAQHDDFQVLAAEIISHSVRLLMLYDNITAPAFQNRGQDHLLERARLRNSALRTHEFGGGKFLQSQSVYKARDRGPTTKEGRRTFDIASLVKKWPAKMNVTNDLLGMLCEWGTISGSEKELHVEAFADLLKLDLGRYWTSLYLLCRSSHRARDTYRLTFLFSIIAFGAAEKMVSLRTLLAFAFSGSFRQMRGPRFESYDLQEGFEPSRARLLELIKPCALPFKNSPAAKLPQLSEETAISFQQRKFSTYDKRLITQYDEVIVHARQQWPCTTPRLPLISDCQIDLQKASRCFEAMFTSWWRNRELQSLLHELQSSLDLLNGPQPIGTGAIFRSDSSDHCQSSARRDMTPGLAELFKREAPCLPAVPCVFFVEPIMAEVGQKSQHLELETMISRLQSSTKSSRKQYGDDLATSLIAFQNSSERSTPTDFSTPISQLVKEQHRSKVFLLSTKKLILDALGPNSQADQLTKLGGLWPRITPTGLLEWLSTARINCLETPWKRALVTFGVAITLSQRAERLLLLRAQNDLAAFYKEAENTGHQTWDPEQYPDWLLLEIDNDLLIRPIQAKVASEMISPQSEANSVIQLNMGEGKSAVIIPMVAAALADGKQLARVIVLKSLTKQMLFLLSQRLGGLVGRRIYYTPFSRKTSLDDGVASRLHAIHRECKDTRGILLAQPEHLLSFKLIGFERLSSGDLSLASELLQAQRWLQENGRDILDESDEILDVRFQVIYTIGSSRMIQGQPNRWLITQEIFSIINRHLVSLRDKYPAKFEVERQTSESFPAFRMLERGASELLMASIVEDIGNGAIPGVAFDHCPRKVRKATLRYIQELEPRGADITLVRKHFSGDVIAENILLLRGLIAHRILAFTLESKRWLVNYGLDPTRCLMAVPYRAKGVPSLNAEFGHPDVAICLTCLSYYYSGLTDSQLQQTFQLLETTDDPTLEYERWQKISELLPSRLRQLNGVNIENEDQTRRLLFPHMRFNKAAIDFFLSQVVFPKEGKEFSKKLSSSGWDIPAEAPGVSLTTGFSGTNDNRYLLPWSIKQQDLPDLLLTSARVLSHVLREENRHYLCAKDPSSGQRLMVKDMLQLITKQDPPVRVLLDVGAQILEMGNRDVAQTWLDLVQDVDAAIFVDEEDDLVVLTRNGDVERLRVSPFRDRMARCIIYLDDVHTRGIDLNIPDQTRAAVTLGPNLTKDKLVQGKTVLGFKNELFLG